MSKVSMTVDMAKALKELDPDGTRGLVTPEVERVIAQEHVDELVRAQAAAFVELAAFTESKYSAYVGAQLSTRATVDGKDYAVTVSIKDLKASATRAKAIKAGSLKVEPKPSAKVTPATATDESTDEPEVDADEGESAED